MVGGMSVWTVPKGSLTVVEIREGLYLLSLFTRGRSSPVGSVWVSGMGKNAGGKYVCFIENSYVIEPERRQGVRTAINDFLFDVWGVDTIVTWTGSKRGGKAFLEASGFVIEPLTGMFVLTKDEHGRRRAKRK